MTKVIGNTTATPNPRPDWNQTDPTKADYIKNKPNLQVGFKYYWDAGIIPSPLEWFNIDAYTSDSVYIAGLSDIWHSLEDDYKYDIVIPYKDTDEKPIDMVHSDIFEVNISSLTIPINVVFGGNDKVSNTTTTIICPPGSAADLFAKENGLNCIYTAVNTEMFNDVESNLDNYIEKSMLSNGQKYYGNAGVHLPSPKEWFNFNISGNTVSIAGMSDIWNSLEDDSKYDIIIPYENENKLPVTHIGDWFLAGLDLNSVIIPNTITTIGNRALYLNNIKSIIIPDSVTSIGEQALDSTVTIICSKGSYAETYAKENGYNYEYDTVTPSDYISDLAIEDNILTVTKGDGSASELDLPIGGTNGSVIVDDVLSETSENPVQNKVINSVLQELINNKSHISHKHTIADIDDYVADDALDGESENPVQNKVITKILNERLYSYNTTLMDDVFRILELETNTVTYIYGESSESGEIEFNFISNANENTTEEVVIILDLYSSVNIPTIQFNENIKWLNGEPPTIEVGKVYMFSFIRAKSADGLVYKYLGIGGEFI